MFTPSLLDVLKENEKITSDDSDIIDDIKDAVGFIGKQDGVNVFQQLRSKENLTENESSTLDLAEVFLPALARFKPGEVMDMLHNDAKKIRDDKKKKGLR
jgi:hypothetical protein